MMIRANDDNDKPDRSERKLLKLEARAKKIPRPAEEDELVGFLLRETPRLLKRCRTLNGSSYEFDRTTEAVDDLLDAREDLSAAERGRPDDEEDDEPKDTAKRLERAYFRIQQSEYFARLSQDRHARDYVLRGRQLYQRARAAYDRREFYRARRLASASTELVDVLENLAQAEVRSPEPPILK